MKYKISGLWMIYLLLPSCLIADDIVRKEYSFDVSRRKPLRIRLEIDAGKIEIEPSRDARKISLNFRFDDDKHELSVDFDEDDNYLRVYFDVDKWFKDHDDEDGLSARMIVKLPTEVPILIDCKTKTSQCDIELGGLKIREFELHVLAGETSVSFSRPNKDKIEELDIDIKLGEIRVEKLGNANFKYANINGAVGALIVDLTSDMDIVNDREIDIDLNIGETRLYLPENEAIRFAISKFLFFSSLDIPSDFYKSGKYYYSDNYDNSKYKTKLSISPGIGTLDIRIR